MKIYNFEDILENDYKDIKRHLEGSGLIIYPTETSYAVGVNALDDNAVGMVYEIKKRDGSKPLPVVIRDLKMLTSMVLVKRQEEDIISIFWPGPLTILFESKLIKRYLFNQGSGLIGARISSHPFIEQLFKEIDFPLVSTSANISGETGCNSLKEAVESFSGIRDEFKNRVIAVDAGTLDGGASTIIKVEKDRVNIVRAGENNIKERFLCYIKNINR